MAMTSKQELQPCKTSCLHYHNCCQTPGLLWSMECKKGKVVKD